MADRLPQGCKATTCGSIERLRVKWGCVDDAPHPFAYLRCWDCGGTSATCATCHGDTRGAPVVRCPHRTLSPAVVACSNLASDYERGVLAVAGGALDQTEWYRQAMLLLLGELARHREAAMKEARANG